MAKERDKNERDAGSFHTLCGSCEGKSCCVDFMEPLVLPKDYEKLQALGRPAHEFLTTRDVGGQQVRLIQRKPNSTTCLFFDEHKMACSIYDHRPLDCRMYPFDILQIEDRLYWAVYHCNPSSSWQWMEDHLVALEQDAHFAELLEHMDIFQAYAPLSTIEFTVLRPVNHP